MNSKKQDGYNFNSVDLLIYIWKKRKVLSIVGMAAVIASIVASMMITPMFSASVIMFPTANASAAMGLLTSHYIGHEGLYGFGEEEQAEQLLQVLHSEPLRNRIIEKHNLMEHYEIDPDSKYPRTKLYAAYKSNINFKLTEFMSVEVKVMDRDPHIAAAIANDITDLVDTVYYNMKKDRVIAALELVEDELDDAQDQVLFMLDSLNRIGSEITEGIRMSGNPTEYMVKAFAENGVAYITMMHQMRSEVGMAINMRYRYNEARLEATQNLPHKFVVERAVAPEKKAYPNKSLIVIVSTFASFLFALIVLIIIDNIKARVALKED